MDYLRLCASGTSGIGYAEIPFLIDTGSTMTFISPYGALRLGISVYKMQPSASIKIGGTSAQVHIMEDTDLYMRTDTGGLVKINARKFGVLRQLRKKENFTGVPSILGIDFLQEFGSLHAFFTR